MPRIKPYHPPSYFLIKYFSNSKNEFYIYIFSIPNMVPPTILSLIQIIRETSFTTGAWIVQSNSGSLRGEAVAGAYLDAVNEKV